MTTIIIAVWLFFMVACFWALVCNERCSRQIRRLIDQVAAANKASDYRKSYWFVIDSVEYDQHLWRLITFRDPWAIYPAGLAEVWKLAA